MAYTYDYPRPMVACDTVVFARQDDGGTRVLLVQRKRDPFAGCWALPGGFLNMDEECRDGAARELAEETGLRGLDLRFLGVYDRVDRDPRGRVLSIVYCAWLEDAAACGEATAGDDAAQARWFAVDALPPLAFDHDRIIADARCRFWSAAAERSGDAALASNQG